ncbi:P-loop NTPase family protein, partial [Staphylococcus epidermidis]
NPPPVVYHPINPPKNKHVHILISHTPPPFQNKSNLIQHLHKIKRLINPPIPHPPHQPLLSFHPTTPQNPLSQPPSFNQLTNLSPILLTKLH